jgi:hypothetical protein
MRVSTEPDAPVERPVGQLLVALCGLRIAGGVGGGGRRMRQRSDGHQKVQRSTGAWCKVSATEDKFGIAGH